MSKINKKFNTQKTRQEMKNYINMEILSSQTLKSFVNTVEWRGDELYLTSKFGYGSIFLKDYLVEIDIELNFLGSMSKGLIEKGLTDEFKKLT